MASKTSCVRCTGNGKLIELISFMLALNRGSVGGQWKNGQKDNSSPPPLNRHDHRDLSQLDGGNETLNVLPYLVTLFSQILC